MAQVPARDRRGLIFGKFLPPHRGHLLLAEHAQARVEELTIAVCSLAREPIPGERRVAWMRELCPDARVVHVTDENPQLPHEHPRFWEIWTGTLLRACGGVPPDALFTSEDYGESMARHLGCRHETVDRPRARVTVSGSAIRADPMATWDFIPEPVRPWFVRRAVLTGSESTGKSTLAPALAARFGTTWTGEFGRAYVDAKQGPLGYDDVARIAAGQIAAEDAAARRADRVLVLDTDLVSTVVYSRHYYGRCPEPVERAARERRAHLYLLHHPDVPWVADGLQRDRGDRRDEMHGLFRDALAEIGARVVDVRGGWAERARIAEAAIEALRSAPQPR